MFAPKPQYFKTTYLKKKKKNPMKADTRTVNHNIQEMS